MEKESRSSLRCPCSIPEDVDEENINAKVEDGILTIELPKLQKVVGKTTKQIEIK